MHVGGLGTLALRPIDPAEKLEPPPIQPADHSGPDRAEGVEPLGPPPLPVGLLQIAAGDVVHADVPSDRLFCSVWIRIPDPFADHDADLGLELHPLGDAGEDDGFTGTETRWAA